MVLITASINVRRGQHCINAGGAGIVPMTDGYNGFLYELTVVQKAFFLTDERWQSRVELYSCL
jgi:hypothetical protein